MTGRRAAALAAALGVLFTACGDGERPGQAGGPTGPVVVYSSVDEVFARPIAERFQEETGIEVRLVPDTEETKSTGLLNRLIAEKERPQADVFWSGDPMRAAILKRRGVSAPYRSPAAAGLPPEFSDSEGHWTGFSTRARVLIYNNAQVPAGEVPQSIMDLLDSRFGGRAAMANPLFGTTSMHAAALFSALGEKAKAFFEGFTANGGKVLSSNGEVRRRVANGEFAVGLTDTDDANVARLEGKPVGIVFPDREGMGTLLVPNCAVLIAGAPHPEAARRFIDYLLRPETEQALAASEAAQIPLRQGVSTPGLPFSLADVKPMRVDYGELAAILERIMADYLKDWVDRNAR
jgi:iron(III) transport system substrate-binding protein